MFKDELYSIYKPFIVNINCKFKVNYCSINGSQGISLFVNSEKSMI